MHKRLAFIVVTCLTAGLIYSFGCGGGGEGETPPPPPPQTIDKVVWGQEVPIDFELAVPVPVTEGEDQKAAKAAINYTDEEKEQAKAVGFFVSNPDGSGAVRLTPKKMSAVQLGEGLAPNGDLWFATKAGIFASNVSDPKPRLILSLQDLATKFSDATEPGLYYPQGIFDNINDHIFQNTSVHFFSNDTTPGQYAAVMEFAINYLKATETPGNQKTAELWLRYDSATGNIDYVFPFKASTSECYAATPFGTGENAGKASISAPDVSKTIGKVIYSLYIATTDPLKPSIFNIAYDPLTGKHEMFDTPWSFTPFDIMQGGSGSAYIFEYYKPGSCGLYQEGVETPFKQEDCKITFTAENPLDVRKKVAACMQNAISGKKIVLKCATPRDVTDLVSSKDKLAGFLGLTASGDAKKLIEIDAGLIKQYEYRESTQGNDGIVSDVECPAGKGYCQPTSSSVFSYQAQGKEKKQILLVKTSDWAAGMRDGSAALIWGIVKDGNEARKALYLANAATGEFKLIDKEDSKTDIYNVKAVPTADGVLFVYVKKPINSQSSYQFASGFNAYYAYDPNWPAPIAITKYIPNPTGAVEFADLANGKKIDSYVVTYDRKYAFLKAQDDMLKANTYMLDLTKIFPQKVVEGEEPKAAKAEGEATTEGATPTTPTINPFGENAKMVNPVLQSQNITVALKAKLGDKLVWTSDQDGFIRLYWNTTENSAFNRFTLADVENNEVASGFAQNILPFVMPSFAVSFDISSDVAAELACGKDNPKATYCADARQMCKNKACVDMYSCSASAPKGDCYDTGKECNEGVCVAKGCDDSCDDLECGKNGCGTLCGTCAAGKTCNAAGKCVAGGQPQCTQNSDCSGGAKICKDGACADCSANSECGAGKKCSNGSCVAMTACETSKTCLKGELCQNKFCAAASAGQECQVVDQCGLPAADFGCINNMCYPKVKNLTLTTVFDAKLNPAENCPQGYSKCKTCKYNFTANWDFNSSESETFNYAFHNTNAPIPAETAITCGNSPCTASIQGIKVTFSTTQAAPSTWVQQKYQISVSPKPVPGTFTNSMKLTKTLTLAGPEVEKCVVP